MRRSASFFEMTNQECWILQSLASIVLCPHSGMILQPFSPHPRFLGCQLSMGEAAHLTHTTIIPCHLMSLVSTHHFWEGHHQHSIYTCRLREWNTYTIRNKCAYVTMQTCMQALRTSVASTSHRAFFLSAWHWALKNLLMQAAQQLTMPQRSGRLESPWQKRKRFEPPMKMCQGLVSGALIKRENQWVGSKANSKHTTLITK